MQRKPAPGFPANSCSIRMPDNIPTQDICNEDSDDGQRRRQQLINFAHSHWGFKNWSWGVTKQELDFVDSSGGKYCAGVVAFVNVAVKSMEIHREDIGYATCVSSQKGSAIFQARKCAVTNALRETLLSFGGTFATALTEALECQRPAEPARNQPDGQENNQNAVNKPIEPTELKNNAKSLRKEPSEVARSPNKIVTQNKAVVPVAKTQPMPNAVPNVAYQHRPPAPAQQGAPLAHVRPNSNVSYVLQPMVPGVMPPVYAQQRMPVPHHFSNYFEYPTPWYYDGAHGNVNLNFNVPPKNVVVNSRGGTVECKNSCSPARVGDEQFHPAQHYAHQGCWIKPTIFYDGFWTEQKVKKWVAEQVDKMPDDTPPSMVASPRPHSHPATNPPQIAQPHHGDNKQ